MLLMYLGLWVIILFPLIMLSLGALTDIFIKGYTSLGLFLSILLVAFVIGYIVVFKKQPFKSETRNKEIERGCLVGFVAIMVLTIIACVSIQGPADKGGGGGTVTCPSCNRRFSETSGNGRSIKLSGLCINCEHNRETANKWLEELPQD